MNCYTHPNTSAVGICKSCCKGICSQCAIEMENGLVCSSACEKKITGSVGETVENKDNGNIQKRPAPHPSTGVVFWVICSIVLWASFLVSFLIYGKFELSTLGFSIISTVVLGIASWNLHKKEQGDKST